MLGERLSARMSELGLSQNELARRVGVSQQTIWKLVSGESTNSRFLHKIARELETTVEQLTGEKSIVSDRRIGFRGFEIEPAEDVQLDEIDVAYGMGGSFIETAISVRKVSFSREWLRHFTDSAPEHLFSAKGIGESMYPTIHTSDVVLVDRSQNTPRMADQIWACVYGEVGMIKRLRPLPNGGIEILSDNSSVPPKTAFDGELHIIGRVVAVVRKM
jgi:phage repressor protein C with HTH and peptisase S24 domain